jgi:O-antigen ligase
MRRWMPVALAAIYAAVPLLPAFIGLTGVAFPGVTVIGKPMVFVLLGVIGLLAVYGLAALLVYRRRGSQPLLLPMLAWFAASVLATLAGFNPAAGLLMVSIFGLGIIWHGCIVRFYGDPGVARAIFWAYSLSALLASVAAIVMVVARAPSALYTIGHGRSVGTFVLPGELAAYLVLFLPVAYVLALDDTQPALRVIARIALCAGFAALVTSYSRAGWMGCAAAFGFLAAMRARRVRLGAAAVVVASGIATVLLLFNVHHNPSEDYTRLSIWQAAIGVIDRFPLTGDGPFDFATLYAVVRAPDADATAFHAHSMYLTFFADLGIVGLGAFLWTAWAFAAEFRRRYAVAQPRAALLALGVTAGLVGVAVQGLIDTMSIVIFGLWLPTLGLALAAAGAPAESEWASGT